MRSSELRRLGTARVSVKGRGVGRAALAIATVFAVLGTSVAAAVVKDPLRLMLRQADMPRGATLEAEYGLDDYLEDALRASGLSGRAAHYVAAASYSKEKGLLRVSGRVITTPSAAQASKALAVVKKADDTFRQRVGRGVPRMTPIALPSFGDQQIARIDRFDSSGIGTIELYVRKRAVVWYVRVAL
ncbi:MAG TPA: hypothetical protein VNP93_09705, partial [Gaiellaceae bacterium]|nr:hypothetical protein [Gaiellaceae bacterium]